MRPKQQYQFVLADDHSLIASGLAGELELQGHKVVGIAHNGLDAISVIKTTQPSCAILDINMPGANGAEVFLEARRWSSKTKFIILTAHPSAALFSNLIEAGVNGLFLKSDNPSEMLDSMGQIMKGQTVLSMSVIRTITPTTAPPELTNRELQVLHGISRGMSNSELAQKHHISAKTIDSHRTNLFRKLSVNSTATLLMKAVKLGLISIND
ncbi:MAG: response regulator transcription factor [Sulfitobacter sp.]